MKENKEEEILGFLQERKYAEVGELAAKLYLSASTVRRRLTELEKKGLVTRAHQNSLEKKKIALTAIKLIKNGDMVFLDGSTSAFFIAEYLSEFDNLKVVTNGIDTLSLLSKNNVTAYSTGGIVSPVNRSVLIGHFAAEMIAGIHADIAFFSAQSAGRDGVISDCFEEENVLRLCMMKNASKKVFLCDGAKFEKQSAFRLCSVRDIDCIVSNRDIRDHFDTDALPELLY